MRPFFSSQFWVVCAASLVMGVATVPQHNTLTVDIEHIREIKGDLKLVLFHQERGFPDDPHKGFKMLVEPVKGNTARVQFTNIPEGVYAVAVYQDLNQDNKMNSNFFDVPSEPFGCSNNPTAKLKRPHFSEAKFEFAHHKHRIKIRLH